MRTAIFLLALQLHAASPVETAQALFDAMKAHDSNAVSALFVPGATLSSVDSAGKVSTMPFEKFAERVGSGKGEWVEQMKEPAVLQHGALAVVWTTCNFFLNGRLSHCGVDSFSLIKTGSGWKIVSISDTREKDGCTS